MLAIQIGIIAFLLLLLAVVNSEEKKKHRQERKFVKSNEFWCGTAERRQTIRIDTELEVLYEVFTETSPNNHKSSVCKNVSLGGINLVINEKLLPETKIYLQLNLPGQNKIILIEGEVIWEKEMSQGTAQKDESERFFNEGIRFVHIKKEDKDILGNFIQTHHPKTKSGGKQMKGLCRKELFLAGLLLLLNGCSEITPPTPNEIIHQPLGESPLRIGMTKEKVKSLWGNADEIIVLDSKQGIIKEEWIYRGRYPNLPINVDYLAETQHLFFDGEHLVNFYHQK